MSRRRAAVIERKVVIVSLFANASDYSNKICIFCKIQVHVPVYESLVGVVTCVREERYTFSQSLQYISAPQHDDRILKYTNVTSRAIGL